MTNPIAPGAQPPAAPGQSTPEPTPAPGAQLRPVPPIGGGRQERIAKLHQETFAAAMIQAAAGPNGEQLMLDPAKLDQAADLAFEYANRVAHSYDRGMQRARAIQENAVREGQKVEAAQQAEARNHQLAQLLKQGLTLGTDPKARAIWEAEVARLMGPTLPALGEGEPRRPGRVDAAIPAGISHPAQPAPYIAPPVPPPGTAGQVQGAQPLHAVPPPVVVPSAPPAVAGQPAVQQTAAAPGQTTSTAPGTAGVPGSRVPS